MRSIVRCASWTLICAAYIILSAGGVAMGQSDAGWQSRWNAAVAQAKKEAKVSVLGPPGDAIRAAIIASFSSTFPGIAVEFTGARGGELATKIKAERDAGIYSIDVIVNGSSTANSYFKPMQALDPLEPALILPEVTDPKNWRDNRLEFSDRGTRFDLVFSTQSNAPIAFNAAQVKPEQVDELYEILDPKWKGKIVLQDPIPSGTGNGMFRWLWHVLGAEKAKDYFVKLRAQAATVDRDQRRQLEWVAQGKYAINFGPGTIMYQLQQRGLKFGIIPHFTDYGAYVSPGFGTAMLVNRAPHPNAAKVFLNWLLGKDGQTVVGKAMGYVSRRNDVSTDKVPSYWVLKAGVKYWPNYYEEDATMSPEQEKFLKATFGR